jgi:sugar phosphate isomerase/epimerase
VSHFNRRQFLQSSFIAPAAVSAAGAAEKASQAPGQGVARKAKVSVLSYSFQRMLKEGTMDVFGYLETCKFRYGLDAADIQSRWLTSMEEDYLKRVREALDQREMILADLCVDGAHIWDDDPEKREQNYKKALAYIEAARILGARFVRLEGGGRKGTYTDEELAHIVKRYREYADKARDYGFRIGPENHLGNAGRWSNLKKVYQAVNHPALGLSIHIGSWVGAPEDATATDREAAPLACHTHLDWNICEGPLEEKLAIFRNAGYTGYFSIEHHSMTNEYTNVAVQLAHVRNVLERFRTGQSKLIKNA